MKKPCGCTEPMQYEKATSTTYAHRRCSGCGEIYGREKILPYEEKVTLYADTVNGISQSGDDSFVTEIVNEATFLWKIGKIGEKDYIRCDEISGLTLFNLHKEYGVK